jgi:sialic acid synthase SpsE
MRSIALKEDLPAGIILTKEMLTLKKPSTGLPETRLSDVIGKRLCRPVSAKRLLTWDDLEND